MHPAFSVIFFTTATGAGYGLLALLGPLAALGLVPTTRWFGAVSLGISLTLITAGLLSSTLHLTHPERAWRAFSQWRSSWLSREGVMSVATYVPAGIFALGWVVLGQTDGVFAAAGIVAAVFALGNRRHHRHDLCVAEAGGAVAQPLYGAGLPDLLRHDRRG